MDDVDLHKPASPNASTASWHHEPARSPWGTGHMTNIWFLPLFLISSPPVSGEGRIQTLICVERHYCYTDSSSKSPFPCPIRHAGQDSLVVSGLACCNTEPSHIHLECPSLERITFCQRGKTEDFVTIWSLFLDLYDEECLKAVVFRASCSFSCVISQPVLLSASQMFSPCCSC